MVETTSLLSNTYPQSIKLTMPLNTKVPSSKPIFLSSVKIPQLFFLGGGGQKSLMENETITEMSKWHVGLNMEISEVFSTREIIDSS